MTEPGQTSDYTLSDHVKAITDHVGEGVIDYCIYDTGEIVPEIIRKYNEDGSDLVEQDTSKAKAMGMHLLKRDLATVEDERIRHNPDSIAASIIELICEDLKFKDMQNNPEYMILNDRLKNKKKKIKKNKKLRNRAEDGNGEDKKSKFFDKYQERIKSIKESEEKFKKRNRKAKQAQAQGNKHVSSDRIKEIDLNAKKRRKLEEDIEKFKTSNKRSRN